MAARMLGGPLSEHTDARQARNPELFTVSTNILFHGTMERSPWRAGFELEVILGDLHDPRFARDLEQSGGMDEASPGFCRTVANRLRELTRRTWTAPIATPNRPGFYVIPEYGLDPLDWPEDRLAGVELLTPPLPLDEADAVRKEITSAIEEIDGSFNFMPSDTTADCGWHINIDAMDKHRLDPAAYIVGTDELLILSRSSRLFSSYTGLQRHAVGISLLRYLQSDRQADLLRSGGLANLLNITAGRSKHYAANFSKLERGYVELRHFSALSFFSDQSLVEHLDRIPASMELPLGRQDKLNEIFLRRFLVLFEWLQDIRERIKWQMGPLNVLSQGMVSFDGEPIGTLIANGSVKLYLHGPKQYEYIASIEEILLPDIAEAVALLALDLSELRSLGIRRASTPNVGFRQAVSRLATRLRSDATLSSAHQLSVVRGTSAMGERD